MSKEKIGGYTYKEAKRMAAQMWGHDIGRSKKPVPTYVTGNGANGDILVWLYLPTDHVSEDEAEVLIERLLLGAWVAVGDAKPGRPVTMREEWVQVKQREAAV